MEPKDKMYSETQDEVTRSGMKPEDVNENAEQTAEKEELDKSPVNETALEKAEEKNNEAATENTVETAVDASSEPNAETVADETESDDEVIAETIVNEVAPKEETVEVKAEAANDNNVDEQKTADTDELAETETQNTENDKPKDPEVDYSKLSEVELINALKDLLENREFMEIYPQVDAIKINFYKKHKLKIQEQKKKFIAEGGYEEEFKAESDPYEEDLKSLMALYRQKKFQYNKLFEAEKEENLKRKYEIIEEIKGLVNRKESINKTFQEFKELQQQWREIGLVPQANVKDMWENYHHHVENFYDYIKINKELRDLDLKKNLDEKIILCEKAEALLVEPSVIKAFNALQKLHDSWREVGPVPTDKKEEIWERFKDATNAINKKHQDFFDNRKKAQKKNLDAKAALCEKVEDIINSSIETHKEWEAKSKEIIELQKYWRTIGFAPKKDNNAIYERFRTACDRFFDMKREFYSKHKEIQSNNLQLKIDLCIQAEALKESTDWKKTTEEFIAIQKKWKEIGPVPRKHSDNVWKRFRAACDSFFERKSQFFNNVDESQVENLKLKKELIDEVQNFKPSGKDNSDLDKLRTFQRRWTDIGHVPIANKNEIQKQFREAINVQFDKLRVDDRDRNLLRFKSKVTDWKDTSKGHNKAYAERDKYVSKLRQLESDLITLQNNIGFFSNSKNAEALIKDVERKIKNNEEQIAYLKEKINIIDDIDNQNE
ncbi:MAG TPA: DUF349 domain-containing protein [Prolixibacteraceae bacterium]|nr:DUF349 domain-containing protein [Prolixibacteraceae bacterium]HPR60177.1 DUF349 domain-containing protein [Prolixibacteraceae bacterium]